MSATARRYTDQLELADAWLAHPAFGMFTEMIDARLEALHGKLEHMGLPDAEANYIRGQVHTLRQMSHEMLMASFAKAFGEG